MAFGVILLSMAGCIADGPHLPPLTVSAGADPSILTVTTASGGSIAPTAPPASGTPFTLRGNDWDSFEASISGEAGSWLFLYVPLPVPSAAEHWSFSIHAEADRAEDGPAVLLTTDVETVVGDMEGEARAMLPRPQAIVSDGGPAVYRDGNSVSSYVNGGDRGTIGFLYAATANTPWKADLSVVRGEGDVPANVTFLQIGNGTVVHRDVTATDNVLDLGTDMTYELAYPIASPGWTHFHFLGPDEGASRWDWSATFPEGADGEQLLGSVHAPPAFRLRGDIGVIDGDAGDFAARIHTTGTASAPTMLFIHAPGLGPWLPQDFANYV